MNFLSEIRVKKFEGLATKTAMCLLGVDCGENDTASQTAVNDGRTVVAGRGPDAGQESNVGPGSANVAEKAEENNQNQDGPTADETKRALTSTIEKMNAEARQVDMNRKSKGPYFIIFILFMLLSAFSLGDDEE